MAVFEGGAYRSPLPQRARTLGRGSVRLTTNGHYPAHPADILTAQGVDVYVIDNWSTDNTVERVRESRRRTYRDIINLPDGPTQTYEWRQMLGLCRTAGRDIEADLFVLHDADQRRHTPWRATHL